MVERHPVILGKTASSRPEPGNTPCARNGGAMEGIIAANLADVRGRIAAAAVAAGRTPASVNLVAVTKTHPAATIRDALAAGHRVFGENRVQEAQAKYPALREAFPDLALHLIGPLQTNKVRDAVALFDVIESIDRPRIAE